MCWNISADGYKLIITHHVPCLVIDVNPIILDCCTGFEGRYIVYISGGKCVCFYILPTSYDPNVRSFRCVDYTTIADKSLTFPAQHIYLRYGWVSDAWDREKCFLWGNTAAIRKIPGFAKMYIIKNQDNVDAWVRFHVRLSFFREFFHSLEHAEARVRPEQQDPS